MKINRCPKCGQEPVVFRISDYVHGKFWYKVGCFECGIKTEVFKTYDEAVAKWNEIAKGCVK